MSTLQPTRTPAGWYPDPYYPGQLRWWDGFRWSHYVSAYPAAPSRRGGSGLVAVLLVVALLVGAVVWAGGGLAGLGDAVQRPPEVVDGTDRPDTPELQEALAAAVTVESDCGFGCLGVGAGVAISPNSLLTAAHVVRDVQSAVVIDKDGARHRAKVVARDDRRDLALLETDPHGLPTVAIRPGVPAIGEASIAVGSPGGVRRISYGHVTDILDLERDGVLEVQTSADIDQGNSGGPLLDAQGRLLGIVVAEHETDDTIGWAISSDDVLEFLAAAGVPGGRSNAAPQTTGSDAGEPRNNWLQDLIDQYFE